MSRRYRLDEEAEQDINEAFDTIAEDNLTSAIEYTSDLFSSFELVANKETLRMGRLEPEFSEIYGEEVRSFLCRNHRYYYSPGEHDIRIFRVIHTSRDVEPRMKEYLNQLCKR